jgi:hypothetical protein
MNANRVQLVYPKAGDVEHWTYINEGEVGITRSISISRKASP